MLIAYLVAILRFYIHLYMNNRLCLCSHGADDIVDVGIFLVITLHTNLVLQAQRYTIEKRLFNISYILLAFVAVVVLLSLIHI